MTPNKIMELDSDQKNRNNMHDIPPVEIQNRMCETVSQGSNLNFNLIKPLDLTTREHRGQRNKVCTTGIQPASKTQLWGKMSSTDNPVFSTKILQGYKKRDGQEVSEDKEN